MPSKIKVLLADDEAEIREKLSLWLIRRGYSVDTAADGNEAMQKLQASDVHILISDLKMPEMDGIDLIKKCVSLKSHVGIIVITAYGDVDSYIETLNIGAFEYLNKPFELEELDCVIQKLIAVRENNVAN